MVAVIAPRRRAARGRRRGICPRATWRWPSRWTVVTLSRGRLRGRCGAVPPGGWLTLRRQRGRGGGIIFEVVLGAIPGRATTPTLLQWFRGGKDMGMMTGSLNWAPRSTLRLRPPPRGRAGRAGRSRRARCLGTPPSWDDSGPRRTKVPRRGVLRGAGRCRRLGGAGGEGSWPPLAWTDGPAEDALPCSSCRAPSPHGPRSAHDHQAQGSLGRRAPIRAAGIVARARSRLTLTRVRRPEPALLELLAQYELDVFGPTGLRIYDLGRGREGGAVSIAAREQGLGRRLFSSCA